MIGVDTKVIVRLLVADDARQADAAARYLQTHCSGSEPAFLSDVVLVETAWVLEDLYGYSRAQIALAMEGLLATAQLKAASVATVNRAILQYRAGAADFADCLLGAGNVTAGCDYTATFDRKAARLAEFRLIGAA